VNVGLIADTHGLLRPEVLETFAGVEHIVHAGDVGSDEVLERLEVIASVTAVAGNVDGGLRRRLPDSVELELAGVRVAVIHGHQLARRTPAVVAGQFPGADLVVFGHSHVASVERVEGTLAVNPGAAGPRRFGKPATVALAVLEHGGVEARILELV
jgi:putative phosphoesterase